MKKVTILISMIMVLLCLGGCNMNKSNIESNGDFATLTEQQKQILTEEGLPLDYNSLTESQQMYLRIADEMLTYINEKYAPYSVHFTYLAYHSPELIDGSTRIMVVPDGGDPSLDTVTVKVNEEVESGYEDDYLDFATRIIHEHILRNYLSESLLDDKFKVIVTDSRIIEDTLPVISDLDETYIKKSIVLGTVFVFISDDICQSNEELAEIAGALFSWMSDNKFYGTPMIELCRDEGLAGLNPNSISRTRIEYGIACASANIDEDGVSDIKIRDY